MAMDKEQEWHEQYKRVLKRRTIWVVDAVGENAGTGDDTSDECPPRSKREQKGQEYTKWITMGATRK